MSPNESGYQEVSILLQRCAAGDLDAERKVYDLAYKELRKLAGFAFRGERPGHTLQPSMLVSEAFLRMPRAGEIEWQGSRHFYAIASRAMRRALIDHAKHRGAIKNPARRNQVELDSGHLAADNEGLEDAILVDQLMDDLSVKYPVPARVVEMHFFAGMTFADIGAVIGKDERTVKRYWKFARLWLHERAEKMG